MKTIQEQIAIMQHFANGGAVEYCSIDDFDYNLTTTPLWDWCNKDYRIKEQSKKVAIEKWIVELEGRYIISEGDDAELHRITTIFGGKKVRLLSSYEVEI